MNYKDQPKSVPPRPGPSAGFVFVIPLVLMFALVGFAAFSPGARLWGVHHLAYYPPLVRIGAMIAVALTFIPWISRLVYGLLTRVTAFLGARSIAQKALTAALLIGFIACFNSLRSTTHLLGDGQLQAKLIERLAKSPDIGYGYLVDFSVGESDAPATSLLTLSGARALTSVTSWNPMAIWQVFSSLLGGLFVYLVLSVVRARHSVSHFPLLFLLAVFSSGIMALFFGYVETYAPMIVVITGYFLASFRTLQARGSVVLPVVLFVLASVLHVQALLLGPALAFLLLWTLVFKRSSRGLRATTIALATVTVAGAAVLAALPQTSRFFLPLFGGDGLHGALSMAHALDILNELWLIIPMFPFFVAMGTILLFAGRAGTAAKPAGAIEPRADSPEDPESRGRQSSRRRATRSRAACGGAVPAEKAFAILVLVPSVLFLFFFFPELGMARDWDLFALPAASFLVVGLVFSKRFLRRSGSSAHVERYLVPALGIAVSIMVPWIGVNASESKSVQRYKQIIEMDATNPGYGYEILAMYYKDRGQEELTAKVYQRAYDVSKNPRHLIAACSSRLAIGELEEASVTLRDYLAKDPGHLLARQVYVEALVRQSAMDDVIRVCREGIEIHPEGAYFYLYLGMAQYLKGNKSDAEEAFTECRRLNPPKVFLDAIDEVTRPGRQTRTEQGDPVDP